MKEPPAHFLLERAHDLFNSIKIQTKLSTRQHTAVFLSGRIGCKRCLIPSPVQQGTALQNVHIEMYYVELSMPLTCRMRNHAWSLHEICIGSWRWYVCLLYVFSCLTSANWARLHGHTHHLQSHYPQQVRCCRHTHTHTGSVTSPSTQNTHSPGNLCQISLSVKYDRLLNITL